MNSRLYMGGIFHARLEPVPHRFRYPIFALAVDLAELPKLDQRNHFFSHNRWGVFSLRDADYLGGGETPLLERVLALLREHRCDKTPARVVLVTAPRVLGYVFNPVSFFHCYDQSGSLMAAIAEINNTYGETHLYVLTHQRRKAPRGFEARYTVPKDFHVSPFNDMNGDYDFLFGELNGRMDIRVNILRDRKPAFFAGIKGRARPLDDRALLGTAFCFPSSVVLNMPRIVWQAAKLHYQKGLKVYTRPNPSSVMTIRSATPSLLDKIGLRFALRLFGRIRHGQLVLTLPDGDVHRFGNPKTGPTAEVTVKGHRFFRNLLKEGDIGFGRSYIEGDWESSNLLAVFDLMIANYEIAARRSVIGKTLGTWAHRAWHAARRNSLTGSRANIEYHYDLGNDFYQTFLDSTMMYSAGIHDPHDRNPEDAQYRKIRRLIKKADLRSEHHLLEIGTGWGTFAIEAARRSGCRVTSITLSREQFDWATKAVKKAGLEEQIDVRLQDYREISGQFDRIVSIEMLEAVGHENLGTYFQACDRLLKPNGRAVIQVITMPDQRYENYLREGDYIQRFIFPGAVCPSLSALNDAMRKHTRFLVHDAENIGPHYAETLRIWRERFHGNLARIRELGFDPRFVRMWDYYFSYCEAGFRHGMVNDLQLVLGRAGEPFTPNPVERNET